MACLLWAIGYCGLGFTAWRGQRACDDDIGRGQIASADSDIPQVNRKIKP